MKKVLVLCCLLMGLPVAAQAANDKVSPNSFICAELVTMPMTDGGQPPIFEALQIDGYVSAGAGDTAAHPDILASLLTGVYTYCQSHPTDKVADVWAKARKAQDIPEGDTWQADKTKCSDYNADPDNGSGFVIWLPELQGLPVPDQGQPEGHLQERRPGASGQVLHGLCPGPLQL